MQKFFSCFACGDKNDTTQSPKTMTVTPINLNQSTNSIKLIHDTEDDKSRTTTTFKTAQTAPSKDQNDQAYITRKLQTIKKLSLPERKAMESQFIRQNLSKSNTIYLVQKQWSQQYTRFLKDPNAQNIRPINNSALFDNNNELLSNIKQKQHYYIITQRVWKFVYKLYGGGPEIPRDIYFPVYNLLLRKHQISPQGIANPLNLCYMISAMQCMLSVQQLSYYFFKKLYFDSTDTKKKPFHAIIHKFVKQLSQTKSSPQSIKQFASNFQTKFNPYQQHDAQEFILYLFEVLHQQMKLQKPGKVTTEGKDAQSTYTLYFTMNKSIIDKCFAGQQQSTVICLECQKPSITYLPFLEISLQLADNNIEGCLKKHFSSQKLNDLYECENCKKKTKAIRQCSITKTPNYLLIALKKFTSSGRKIEDRIKYSLDLDISKYSKKHHGQTRYFLSSLIVHKGTRSNKGHYYCYARRGKKQWFYCNDQAVRPLQPSQVLGRDAYILIYQRLK